MSLIKTSQVDAQREALTTESEIIEKQKEQKREYEKQLRKRHIDSYNESKAVVDGLESNDDLFSFINASDSEEARVGNHSMKINAQEHAIIKLALSLTEGRSSRKLFIEHCKKIISSNYNM